MKQQLAIIALSLIILIMLMFRKCNMQPEPMPVTIEVDNQLAEIEKLKLFISKQDSIINAKQRTTTIYRTIYKTKYDTLIKQAPDTCKPYLAELNSYCLKLDSMNKDVINSQSILIDTLHKQVHNYIGLDSLRVNQINDLNKVVDKANRKAKFNLFKGGSIGIVIGYLLGKII